MNEKLSNYRLNELRSKLRVRPLDIMLVGVTGVGKSSTINAIVGNDSAKVGIGVDPETQYFNSYDLNDYIRFWDTPGIGDLPTKDEINMQIIASYLNEQIDTIIEDRVVGKSYLIDIVLIVIDGSGRDMGGVYKLLNNTILHNIDTNRILFAINQADVAMKGKHWVNGKPDDVLSDFLNRKAESIQKRIENEIHRKILRPICYSASNEYNIKVLIDYILDNMCETREI